MSEWLTQRIAEQKAAVEQAKAFDYAAEALYDEVLSSCDRLVAECRKHGFTMQNRAMGAYPAVYIMYKQPSQYEQMKPVDSLTVNLSKDKRSIFSKSNAEEIPLSLRFNAEDNTANAMHDGEPITTDTAAEVLFDAFLFSGKSPYAFPKV